MSDRPNIDELLKRARRLVALLEKPEPGLASWLQGYAEASKAMMEFWLEAPVPKLKAGKPQVLEQECPYCLYRADRTLGVPEGVKDRPAHPGDIGMCVKCGEFSVYDAELDLVRMDDDFRAALSPRLVATMEKARRGWAYAKASTSTEGKR
jgi:hypothetical protein